MRYFWFWCVWSLRFYILLLICLCSFGSIKILILLYSWVIWTMCKPVKEYNWVNSRSACSLGYWGKRLLRCCMTSFLLESVSLYVTSVGLSIIWYYPFRRDCKFLDIPYCVLKLGIKTKVPIFKSVAGMKRELIWLFIFCLCNNFFVTSW